MPCPCHVPAVLQQCPVLRENPRVTGKIRTANRETPRGSRKKPNPSRSPTGRRETTNVNSHIPCRAVPWPWEVTLKAAWSEHGMGTTWYVWINTSRLSTACGRSAQVRFLPTATRSFTIGRSDFSGYTRIFTKDTAWSEHGRGTAWYVWIRHSRTALFKWERHNLNL